MAPVTQKKKKHKGNDNHHQQPMVQAYDQESSWENNWVVTLDQRRKNWSNVYESILDCIEK